jgi:hypothetical protein
LSRSLQIPGANTWVVFSHRTARYDALGKYDDVLACGKLTPQSAAVGVSGGNEGEPVAVLVPDFVGDAPKRMRDPEVAIVSAVE